MNTLRHAFVGAVLLTAALTDSTRAEAGGPIDDSPVDAWRGIGAGCDGSGLSKGVAMLHLSKQKPSGTATNMTKLHVSPSRTWKLGESITDSLKSTATDGETIVSHTWVSLPFTASKGESVTYQRTRGTAEARIQICEYYRKKTAASWGDFNENDLVAGETQAYIAGSRLGSGDYAALLRPDRGPKDKSGLVDSKIVVIMMIAPTADLSLSFKLKSL